MTWLNPLALLGVIALGVPIFIHLFGRRVARRVRFPSLRLLGEALPTPATRARPSDLLLLVVRCTIVLAAVLALAQPLWLTSSRSREAARPVRVVLVDTSASMQRLTSGARAVEAARIRGRAVLDSSRQGIVIESADPGSSLAGAASWLAPHAGRREVVIVSDFQAGSVHDGQVATVPAGIGLRFERIGLPADDAREFPVPAGYDSIRADSSGTYASWRAGGTDSLVWPTILASAVEAVQVRTHAEAIRSLFHRGLRSTDRVAIVFPEYEGRRELASRSSPVDSVWQGDLLIALRRDRMLADLARTASPVPGCDLPGTIVVRTEAGIPLASIARVAGGAPSGLLLFSCVDAGSLASAALLAGVALHLEPSRPLRELEPAVLPDEQLQRWHREPTVSAPRGTDDTSPDGRWLWLLAVALLGVEQVLRRRSPRRSVLPDQEEARARVA